MQLARFVGSFVAVSVLFTAAVANADDKKPVEAKKEAPSNKATTADASPPPPISASPIVGYATEGLKLGTGVRAGYTLPMNVYVGGTFVYHFGTSKEAFGYEMSARAMYPAAEVGYDLHLSSAPVTVRPYLGGGVIFMSASTKRPDGVEQSASGSSPILFPGVTVQYEVLPTSAGSPGFFVGADARVAFITDSDGDPSLGMFLVGGVRF